MNEVTISTTGRIFLDGDIKQLKRYHEYLEMKNSWIEEQEQLASIKEPNTRLPEPPFSTNILLHQNYIAGKTPNGYDVLGILDYTIGTNGGMFDEDHFIITCIYIKPEYQAYLSDTDVVKHYSKIAPVYVASYGEEVVFEWGKEDSTAGTFHTLHTILSMSESAIIHEEHRHNAKKRRLIKQRNEILNALQKACTHQDEDGEDQVVPYNNLGYKAYKCAICQAKFTQSGYDEGLHVKKEGNTDE